MFIEALVLPWIEEMPARVGGPQDHGHRCGRSLLRVVVPAREPGRLGERLRDAVSELLLDISVPAGSVNTEVRAVDHGRGSGTRSTR